MTRSSARLHTVSLVMVLAIAAAGIGCDRDLLSVPDAELGFETEFIALHVEGMT